MKTIHPRHGLLAMLLLLLLFLLPRPVMSAPSVIASLMGSSF